MHALANLPRKTVGDGLVEPDPAEAYVWLELAAERGHRTAGDQRDKLAASLSPQQLARAVGLLEQQREPESPGTR